jgi:hypothetical protein
MDRDEGRAVGPAERERLVERRAAGRGMIDADENT